MELVIQPFLLLFKRTFVISHGTRDSTPIVLITLRMDGIEGFGESALPPYYPETTESVLTYLNSIRHLIPELVNDQERLHQWMKGSSADPAAKAGMEMAILDLRAKREGLSLAQSFHVPSKPIPPCSLTIGAGTEGELKDTILQNPEFTLYKLKLNGTHDVRRVELARSYTTADLAIDVNGGWDSVEYAIECLKRFRDLGVIFAEQPFPRGQEKMSRALKEQGIIPIIADESVRTPDELDQNLEHFDGFNFKLMKCPGLLNAMDMIREAKSHQKKVLIGCMSESSCGVGAAAALQAMADWVDLDGPLLIKNDPFEGIIYAGGKISIKGRTGIGVTKRNV